MPCTTLLVGKNASYDGSTMMARNEDSGSGEFTSKKFIVVNPKEQPLVYKSVLSGVTIKLPENPMRYTAMPDAVPKDGIWGEAGFNECNVAMSETETLTSNARVLGADPLVKTGIGEEDMLTIVLPYIHSAREGVKRLGSLLEEYGTYEMNGIGFQDMNEIWWLESIGGHHWMAKRVPDDAYVVMPNQLGIDSFDFRDAYGEEKDHMCSADLLCFVKDNHLDLSMGGVPAEDNTAFDARAAFGSHSDADHCYNTPRAWFMLRYFNPNAGRFDGPGAPFSPESDDLPWCMVPEKKITVEDVKYALSSYYQGTPFNPYEKHPGMMNADRKAKYRPIGINRNNFLAITQLRPYLPKEITAVEWLSVGCNAFNTSVPFYGNVTVTPEYLANTTGEVTTENFYWSNRLIGALADAHYTKSIFDVERYQLGTMAKAHAMLKGFEQKFMEERPENVQAYLEGCNQEMADYIKKETAELLGKVLFTCSLEMKNAFSRNDV